MRLLARGRWAVRRCDGFTSQCKVRGDGSGDLQDPRGENRITGMIQSQGTVLVAERGHRLHTVVQERSGADVVQGHHDERFFWYCITRPGLWEKLWERKNGESLILGARFALKCNVKSFPPGNVLYQQRFQTSSVSVAYYVETLMAKVSELLLAR